MEWLFSSAFGTSFFALGTVSVITLVWQGYAHDRFSPVLATGAVVAFVSYMTAFLLYRYLTGHMSEHASSEASYAAIAALHGSISLGAIMLGSQVFLSAKEAFGRGENYFRLHRKRTLFLILLWPLALLTGFLF